MQKCISNLTAIGSDNGWLPSWRQAIIWTNAGTFLIAANPIEWDTTLI